MPKPPCLAMPLPRARTEGVLHSSRPSNWAANAAVSAVHPSTWWNRHDFRLQPVQRHRTASDHFITEEDLIRPLAPEDEKRFRDQQWKDNMRVGGKIIFLVDVLYILWSIRDLAEKDNTNRLHPLAALAQGDYFQAIIGMIIYGYPTSMLPVFYFCIKRHRRGLYVLAVSSFFFYLLLQGVLDPRATLDGCSPEQLERVPKSGLRIDSNVHLLMAWVLLTPSIFPTKGLVHLTWLYIAFGYVGASLWAHFRNDDGQKNTLVWAENFAICTTILLVVNGIALNKKYYLEKGQRSKFVMDLKHKASTRRMYHILEYMVPTHLVAPMLKNPGKVIAEKVEKASILFIMFADFDKTADKLELHQPHQLLDFLNHHFTLFDGVCAKHGVTKIETVGEEYVAAVGVVPADVERSQRSGHQEILGRLVAVAAEILRITAEHAEVNLKMGAHTGPVVAGVIGNKLPRFRLFGDTINTAARMMQKGLPGKLQFGEQTYADLPKGVPVELRGQIEMKGKGLVTTYLLQQPQEIPTKRQGSKQVTFAGAGPGPGEESRVAGEKSVESQRSSRKSVTETILEAGKIAALGKAEAAGKSRSFGDMARAVGSVAPQHWGLHQPSLQRRTTQKQPPVLEEVEVELASLSGTKSSPLLTQELEKDVRTAEAFENAVHEVCAATSMSEVELPADGTLADRSRRWLLSLGPGWASFPKDTEASFVKWYHESAIVKKLDRRLDAHLLMASFFTTGDLMLSVFVTNAFRDEPINGDVAELRLPYFMIARVLAFAIVVAWRHACDTPWILKSPKDMQLWLLGSYALVALLWFLSFDTITAEGSASLAEATSDRAQCPVDKENWEGIFKLALVPSYFIVTTLHPFLFIPSCTFIVESLFLSYLSYYRLYNLHFETSTMFVLVGSSALNTFIAHTSEKSLRARYTANTSISLAQDRIQHILSTLMPVQVVEEIQQKEMQAPPRAHDYDCATVAQSDLCGFTKLASTRRPEEVVEFISELFGAFDELTDHYEIYKVETVGDAYIAGMADKPLTYKNSPLSVVLFGLDMVRATQEWSRKRGESVSCRVGVHTGKCIGGIVGSEMQRYHLFGQLMAELEIMESTAPEGRVQVSAMCKEAVEKELSRYNKEDVRLFEPRAEGPLTTSKGEVHHVDFSTFVVVAADPRTAPLLAGLQPGARC